MDLDLRVIERNLFTILDLLADVGGLDSILTQLISLLVVLWNRHGLANLFIIDQLYTAVAAGMSKQRFCERRKRRNDYINQAT